ncbi:unnamed protein product, partial [Medioppia subpectinata]
ADKQWTTPDGPRNSTNCWPHSSMAFTVFTSKSFEAITPYHMQVLIRIDRTDSAVVLPFNQVYNEIRKQIKHNITKHSHMFESGDDCIQCPFHGWRFGGDGQCKRIPNLNDSELKTVKAIVTNWPTVEKNELIYIWHHSGGADPDHYPEDFLANCVLYIVMTLEDKYRTVAVRNSWGEVQSGNISRPTVVDLFSVNKRR